MRGLGRPTILLGDGEMSSHHTEYGVPASRKVLMLVLDSGSPELLRQWTADGTLPNIARIRHDGLVLDVAGPEGLEVGATWPSFSSGQSPGEHGICWLDRVIPGTYRELRMVPSEFAHLTTFWEALSEAGRRVVVLDVPFTPRPRRLNGVQVTEWGAHDGVFGFHTKPSRLKAVIKQTWGEYPSPLTCDTLRLSPDGYRKLADGMIRGSALRGAMTRTFLADGRWDFGIQVFTELHCAGHLLWHFHDPTHPSADPVNLARNGDLLREVYLAVDAAVGEILSVVGPETTVIVGSLHGMQHTCGSSLLLPGMLEGLGVLCRASRAASAPGPRPQPRGLRARVKAVYHQLPSAIRVPLYELRQGINRHWLHRGEPIDIEPSRTRAFQMGFGAGSTFSGIRLNLKGREPAGILAPGDDADRFCEQLRRDLLEFTDPDTGRPLVRRVLRTADLYPGPRLHDLPDLLVEWEFDPARGSTAVGSGAGGVWRGFSDRTGLIEHPNGSGRTGAHRLPGLLFARGPQIRPGTIARVISTLDFPPTIARMLGCELPGMSGRPIPELLQGG